MTLRTMAVAKSVRRTWPGALALASTILLGACTDGYPSEDAPLFEPSRMTQAQLLEELNALGAEPMLDKRWRYTLEAGCELRISVRKGQPPERRVPMVGTGVDVRSARDRTEVLLVPTSGDESAAVVVLETRRWTDTVSARLLLTHLEMSCRRPPHERHKQPGRHGPSVDPGA